MAVVTSHLYRCPFDPTKDRQNILGEGINGRSSIRIRPISLALASGRNDREVGADVTGFSSGQSGRSTYCLRVEAFGQERPFRYLCGCP